MNASGQSTRPPRQRVLDGAMRVFADNGYQSGSINDVASAAGMSRHNLLYYFPSKRELLIGLLETRDAQVDERLRWMTEAAGLPLSTFLDELERVLPELYADRDLMRLYHWLSAEAANPAHPAHPWVSARYDRLRAATVRLFRDAEQRGELATWVDPDGLATAMLGAIEGIESQWLVAPDLSWNRAAQALKTLLTSALREPPT